MNIDLHNHTKLCNHAIGECYEYVESAIKNGINIFGFACHAPMEFDKKYRMSVNEIDSYIYEIRALGEKYRDKISVKVGFEVDYIYKKEYLIEKKVLESDVDYLIGSVHFLNNWGFDNEEFLSEYNKIDINDAWKQYLQSIIAMAESRLFDIVGHFDLFKIFNNKPSFSLQKDIYNTLEAIKDNDMVLEINTAGIRKPICEIYPSRDILELAYKLEIPITFSSDAHSPSQVGFKKDFAISLAKDIGFKEVVSFSLHKREVYKI
ncbi:histidinol-phosphatase [Helicobacter sp. MIT 14-3879]|uniref:histidinol-phosphatase n=1 Tax=Helicobacter sp. MIT 14-3879 TaxID=2040649 RepID=UPI000E1E7703|nr:histidinol-phosphatase [Helicobacter sp. MIT 14-3879]RDU62439.1 histidinol phosphate phosphatase [Helicobacter sp. MIT 14-3879]